MNSANENSRPSRRRLRQPWYAIARFVLITWASPGTVCGVAIGVIGLLSGGRHQFHSGVLEFYGGATARFLRLMPVHAAAMTFGHVVLGRDIPSLDFTRAHERIHVRQYERWGPLFIPAYLAFSAVLWMMGRDAYRDNPFEVEAFSNS